MTPWHDPEAIRRYLASPELSYDPMYHTHKENDA